MIRTLTTVLLAAIILGTVSVANAAPARTPSERPFWTERPCKTEDSVNCFWDAKRAGNTKGRSYIVRKFPGRNHTICVMYVDRRYAKRHDYCT